jgi:hypothetical protein
MVAKLAFFSSYPPPQRNGIVHLKLATIHPLSNWMTAHPSIKIAYELQPKPLKLSLRGYRMGGFKGWD